MQLVGFAVLLLAWVVMIVGAVNMIVEALRDRRLAAYVLGVRYLPSLMAMGTFRQIRRGPLSSMFRSIMRGR